MLRPPVCKAFARNDQNYSSLCRHKIRASEYKSVVPKGAARGRHEKIFRSTEIRAKGSARRKRSEEAASSEDEYENERRISNIQQPASSIQILHYYANLHTLVASVSVMSVGEAMITVVLASLSIAAMTAS